MFYIYSIGITYYGDSPLPGTVPTKNDSAYRTIVPISKSSLLELVPI